MAINIPINEEEERLMVKTEGDLNAILCHLSDDIQEVFELSGFLQLFKKED